MLAALAFVAVLVAVVGLWLAAATPRRAAPSRPSQAAPGSPAPST